MRLTIFCNHYRSMSDNKTCSAGVEYENLKDIPFDQRPCFARADIAKAGYVLCGNQCAKAEFPTPEQIAKENAESEAYFKNMTKARDAIVAHLGGPWKKGMKGDGGTIACPICQSGTLGFSRSGYNGHIHARCTTDKCMAWME